MRTSLAIVLGLPLLVALGARPSRDALPAVGHHDNDVAAGTLRDGELTLAMEIRRGSWHPNGPFRPGTPMLAFAEPGKPLRLPGPMIRVPVGTRLRISVTNTSDSSIVVRGLSDDRTDSLVLAAGATGEVRSVAAEAGNRFYYGTIGGRALNIRGTEDGHLAGAIIVDAGPRDAMLEQVLVITGSFHSRDSLGRLTNAREFYVLNGRPWPTTPRLNANVGDSLRFRILNASRDLHPMHLHGTYFRVDSRGSGYRDTVYAAEERRMAVTEALPFGATMNMVFSPDRPGTWLMHCHLTFHVVGNPGFGPDSVSLAEQDRHLTFGHPGEDPDMHVERNMGGLMMSITVAPPRGWKLPSGERRLVRFVVPRDSIGPEEVPGFAPSIIDERGARPALDRRGPGATLFLRQGEPTTVRVLNESRDPIAIHWHGMELESLYDGVVHLGGTDGSRMRAVVPRDSFDARMTPPRAGTFIYHTHLMEVRQQESGLYGAMIVLPPGEEWDAGHDHVFMVGTRRGGPPVLNGSARPPELVWEAGSAHRLRLVNITTGSPGLRFDLIRADSVPVQWTSIAKDGMDLPARQQRTVNAFQPVAMGETYDMRFTAAEPGVYLLRARPANPALPPFAVQSIRVVPRGP
jgi:FtsP/CotA-like multicopper oxidase with cupredoxin domain